AYFVTIVTRNRECLFGDVVDGAMRVNAWGQIVVECWDALPTHFPNVELDAFVVMPNHVHGIIVIVDDAAPRRGEAFFGLSRKPKNASPLHPQPPRGTQSGSVGAIIQNFKSVSARKINASRDTAGAPVWQRNYYEHIIRNEKSLHAIRAYIENNPAHWAQDDENPRRQ
ncbi:MAG: transposase, partial [Anaerolineae bacterium]|nr:transposase [Anaerolineae bacterium]